MESSAVISGSFWSRLVLPLLLAAGLAGCASSGEVKEDEIVRLPMEDRQTLADEERVVDVAEANLAASRDAVKEAEQFESMVDDEIDAADANIDAAEKSVKIQKEAKDDFGAKTATEHERAAVQNMNALKAKKEYAKRLRDLREQQHILRETEFNRAQTQLERAEYEALRANGMGKNVDPSDFDKAAREAEHDHAEAVRKVSQAEGYAQAAQATWHEQRQQAEMMERDVGGTEAKPIPAPAPLEDSPESPESPQAEP